MTTIIIKESIKKVKLDKIKSLFQVIHGVNCPCHTKNGSGIVRFLKKDEHLPNIVKMHKHKLSLFDNRTYTTKQEKFKYNIDNDYIQPGCFQTTSDSNKYKGDTDYAFEMSSSSIRYGKGVTSEVGYDLSDLGCKSVCIFTDQNLISLKDSPVWKVCESLKKQNISFVLYDRVSIEPTDASIKEAAEFMLKQGQRGFDGIVAIGGGSVMDTAKLANLYSCYPPQDFLDYVNSPIGKGLPVPGPLKPLIAIPTTAGTGSEVTGVGVFGFVSTGVKTGIANRRLKPTLGLIDSDNTRTCPTNVSISSGLDQFCHSLESFTAIPFNQRSPRPSSPIQRPSYQGSNPISDMWSLKALEMIYKNLPIVAKDPENEYSRSQLILAATYAGIGFGNAGVHLCHGMSYAISGGVRDFKPDGYNTDHPIIPHGMSVVLSAPAVFKFTGIANPKRHLICAQILGADISNVRDEDAGLILSNRIKEFISSLHIPNGLKAVGYTKDDIPELVKGTLPQHRVTKISPRPVGEKELSELFEESLTIY